MMNSAIISVSVSSVICAAGLARGVVILGNGDSVTVAAVLASQDRQVQVGDKLFTFLTYFSNGPTAGDVSISGFISVNPLDGTGFDMTGGFGDIPNDGIITDMNLHYTVEVANPQLSQGYRIKDTGLTFNGSAVGAGAYARVDELIFNPLAPPGQDLLGSRHVFFNAGPPQSSSMQDNATFANNASYTRLEINKDIQFYAPGQNSQASASFVRQTFSQSVPGPASVVLAGAGGALFLRRRRPG